jgi:hypothetical protein
MVTAILIFFLVAVVVSYLAGELSPRALGFFLVIGMASSTIVLTTILMRSRKHLSGAAKEPASPLGEQRRETVRKIRRYKLSIAFMLVTLVAAIYVTRHDALWPRITGSLLNIGLTYSLFRALRTEQRKIKKQ